MRLREMLVSAARHKKQAEYTQRPAMVIMEQVVPNVVRARAMSILFCISWDLQFEFVNVYYTHARIKNVVCAGDV